MPDDNALTDAGDDLNDPNVWAWVVGLVVLLIACSVLAIATHDEHSTPQSTPATETAHRTEP